jgi:hypothetical protein
MGPDNAPTAENFGRVEIFAKKRWGTVCNKGWNENSAMVACK